LIFSKEHPRGKEIQVCSNEVPRVINGHALRGHIFIWAYIAKTLKIFFSSTTWPISTKLGGKHA